ncbi:MAG: cation-transporting P-type ATPase, partial [Clostridia bacterium]|nr:cation-transporting P-type ATPase [Clostridia bacterium]
MEKEGRLKKSGLMAAEVAASRRAHGANVYTHRAGKSFWQYFFKNLGDPVIKVLLFALGLHLLLLFRDPDLVETAGIAVSVVLATLISTLSEYRSERAFSRLFESCGSEKCRVRRDGSVQEIDVEQIVVGDVVVLGAGEKIPADGVVIGGGFTVDQSALTGESCEVEKRAWRAGEGTDPAAAGALLAGCGVLSGAGEMQVLRVGDATCLGGISGEMQEERRESPLKRRRARLAAQISRIGYVMAGVCALGFLFHELVMDAGFERAEILSRVRDLPFLAQTLLRALTLALTVVVVAVPEGLPMMIAVVLSSNIRRMVRDRVLVRRPAGLEAAGSMNILFTDKTGTLTRGELSLCAVLCATEAYPHLRGLQKGAPALYEQLSLAVHLCSGAVRGEREGRVVALGGNATDRALLTAFLDQPAPAATPRERIPFDSARKWAAARGEGGEVFVCGAPEKLLAHVDQCLDGAGKARPFRQGPFLAQTREHAARGERVLLFCTAEQMPEGGSLGALCLVGAVCFCDPVRSDAPRAVQTLRRAGVQVVMLTGDSRETACAVARACGILHESGVVLTGEELAARSDEEVRALLPRLAVVARALPADKSRLVRAARACDMVVGMTGDGVNDAPALIIADVGFAMGS